MASPSLPVSGAAVRQDGAPQRHAASFIGSGTEYFYIWIVNALLITVTLGIYFPWAKVRSQKYLHENTILAGAPFGYHAEPLAILKGRAIGVLLFLVYTVISDSLPIAAGIIVSLLLTLAASPWLLHRSLRFRLANLSYRGLRFGFQGSLAQSYLVFAVWPMLTALTLGLLWPFAHRAIKAYQHDHSLYAGIPFSFHTRTRDFYAVYGLWLLSGVLIAAAPLAMGYMLAGPYRFYLGYEQEIRVAVALWICLVFVGMAPLLTMPLRNLIWNGTALGPHRIVSQASMWQYMSIQFTNSLLIVLTLGLFLPLATVRKLRYLAACTAVMADGSLDGFAASRDPGHVSATGDETADIFGLDVAL